MAIFQVNSRSEGEVQGSRFRVQSSKAKVDKHSKPGK
jgi:hypothetical protein